MIPENNNIIDIKTVKLKNNVGLKSKNTYYQQTFYTNTFYSEKEFSSFCKATERLIRRSSEYDAYLSNLKFNYDLTSCAFFNNISDEDATIEMHHYPFTLYDIVTLVVQKFLKDKKLISSFVIAKEVMKLHFTNKVGLVPLSKTVHELVHSGEIFINYNQVFGDFSSFAEEYSEFMTPKMIDDYNKLLNSSKQPFNSDMYSILKYNENGVQDGKENL